MKTVWLKGITNPDQKREVRQEYIKSAPTRIRLKEMLEDKIASARNQSRKESSYESPNWALMQADTIGYERALSEVISIIFDEKVQKQEK